MFAAIYHNRFSQFYPISHGDVGLLILKIFRLYILVQYHLDVLFLTQFCYGCNVYSLVLESVRILIPAGNVLNIYVRSVSYNNCTCFLLLMQFVCLLIFLVNYLLIQNMILGCINDFYLISVSILTCTDLQLTGH